MASKISSIRKRKFHSQHGRCYYCNCLMWEGEPTAQHAKLGKFSRLLQCTAEHLHARGDGGSDVAENIVAVCHWCNKLRHARPIPLQPEVYKNHVRKRVQRGKWHPVPLAGWV